MLDFLIGIKADGRQLDAAANKSVGALGRLSKAAAKLGRALTAAFIGQKAMQAFNRLREFSGRVSDLSSRMAISTDKVQEWNYAAEQTGTSIERVATSFRYLQDAIQQAIDNPRGDIASDFERLGISLAQLRSEQPERIFERIADAFATLPESTAKTSATLGVLGRSADQLFVSFRQGFSQVTGEADKFSLVIDEGVIQNLDAVNDQLVLAGAQVRAFFAEAISGAGGLLTAMQTVNTSIAVFRTLSRVKGGPLNAVMDPTTGLGVATAIGLQQAGNSEGVGVIVDAVDRVEKAVREAL